MQKRMNEHAFRHRTKKKILHLCGKHWYRYKGFFRELQVVLARTDLRVSVIYLIFSAVYPQFMESLCCELRGLLLIKITTSGQQVMVDLETSLNCFFNFVAYLKNHDVCITCYAGHTQSCFILYTWKWL